MEQKRRIVPPIYFLGALLVMIALHFFAPLVRIVEPPLSYLGALPAVAGIWISAWGASAFRKVGAPVVPFERSTVLVDTGLYRFTRNPMYLGLLIALIGVSVLLGSASAFIPIVPFVWIIQTHFILGEEKFLEEIFGAQYLAYKQRVRRWL